MCTVSFIPVRGNVLITSNRDEKNYRRKAGAPVIHVHNGTRIVFPKDGEAGGTWIAMKENGDAAVLLNGAFICHASQPPYRKSRGLVFLDIFSTERPSWTFYKANLYGIEPFTMIIFEKGCLYEFRWDGEERYCRQLSANRPHIWSSVTLYDGLAIKKREHWFARFLNEHPQPTQQDVLKFHRFSGDGDPSTDLMMSRQGTYSTVSVTAVLLNGDRGVMTYADAKDDITHDIKIGLVNPVSLW